ncbi:MAG: hypothetical protein ACRD0J_15040 [Acidimicrobiales bacterium]
MSSAHPGEPAAESPEVTFFAGDEGSTFPLAAWLDLVAGDEPTYLPRPAGEYLAEAWAAGEV